MDAPSAGLTFTAVARAGPSEAATLLAALARLHVRGIAIDWRSVYAGSEGAWLTCRPTPSSVSGTGWTYYPLALLASDRLTGAVLANATNRRPTRIDHAESVG